MTLSAEEMKILRQKRENVNGERAHALCLCGCPISGFREACPNCASDTIEAEAFGIAILQYRREEQKKRMDIPRPVRR